MSKRKGPNRENLEQTRRAFLKVARREFVKAGYNHASTNAIVQESGMARGSLYYHFGDKFGLFEAVYTEMMEECYHTICEEMDKYKDIPEKAILAGCDVFLDYCTKLDFRKIVLIEAQSALTYQERMGRMEATLLKRLRDTLSTLENKHQLKGYSINTVVIFVVGILSEIGRSFDSVTDIMAHREECTKALRVTLKSMIG